MSEILHIIMESSLAIISHIAKYSFHFKNRLDKHIPYGNALSTCNIKSLYTKFGMISFYVTVEYLIEKFQNDLPLLRRINKQFILEGFCIILEFN